MHLWGGALLHLKWALRRFKRVQGTRHKVSGPLTRDVRMKDNIEYRNETVVRHICPHYHYKKGLL